MTVNAEALNFTRKLLAQVRKLEGDMSIRRLQVLLEVYARQPETDIQTLLEALDMSPSGMTKLLQSWSFRDAYKRKGPGYIKITPDPENLKTRIVEISGKGLRGVSALFDF